MRKYRPFIREAIVHLSFLIFIYAIMAFLVYWPYHNMALVYDLSYMAVPFALLWLVRDRCGNVALFTTLHIIITAGACALIFIMPIPGLNMPWGGISVNFYVLFRLLFLIFITGYSLVMRFSENRGRVYDKGTSFFYAAALALLCVLCEYMLFSEIAGFTVIAVAAVLALRFVYGHMESLDASMDIADMTAAQPVGKILSFNNKLIIGFTALLVLTAAAARWSGLDAGLLMALMWLGNALRMGLRFLFGLLPGDEEPSSYAIPDAEPMALDPTAMFAEEAYREPSLVWVILEKIIIYVGGAAGIALFFGLVAYVCYQLYKRFYSGTTEVSDDLQESVMPDWRETMRGKVGAFIFGGPANRVRRLFYRKVRKHIIKKAVSSRIALSDTACEIAEKIKASEDIDALTARYTQARYSEKI